MEQRASAALEAGVPLGSEQDEGELKRAKKEWAQGYYTHGEPLKQVQSPDVATHLGRRARWPYACMNVSFYELSTSEDPAQGLHCPTACSS